MPTTSRTWALTAATMAGVLGLIGVRPASAQNTYADVPFQQGSLFYRPSGARPPRVITTRPMRSVASPRRFRFAGRRFLPTRRVYTARPAQGYRYVVRPGVQPTAPIQGVTPTSYYAPTN
jgi:hypothetical protein